jgi:hypothetical protein
MRRRFVSSFRPRARLGRYSGIRERVQGVHLRVSHDVRVNILNGGVGLAKSIAQLVIKIFVESIERSVETFSSTDVAQRPSVGSTVTTNAVPLEHPSPLAASMCASYGHG